VLTCCLYTFPFISAQRKNKKKKTLKATANYFINGLAPPNGQKYTKITHLQQIYRSTSSVDIRTARSKTVFLGPAALRSTGSDENTGIEIGITPLFMTHKVYQYIFCPH
ncbi:MAG: hypothetical protein N0E59_21420, partial [Candidatus Thiodiazotropha taylori]|nr:hypothetical protein [Candidatus Thiodiazotropha taylori]MCW4285681.1 hypothetical protein [Candidatus Thiodiazotropha taylori]